MGQLCNPEGYAAQVLPRSHWRGFQHHTTRSRCCREQEGRWSYHRKARACPCGACASISLREEFLNRVKSNDAQKIEAKKSGTKVVTKRQPRMPKAGFTVKKAEVVTKAPVAYDPIY